MDLLGLRFIDLSSEHPPDLTDNPGAVTIGVAPAGASTAKVDLDDFAFTLTDTLNDAATSDRRLVVVDDLEEAKAAIEKTVTANPIAALTACEVLAANAGLQTHPGLLVESLAYSMLQSGVEFNSWLDSRIRKPLRPEGDPVHLHRSGDLLEVTLDRPHKHNALNRAMRDGLLNAFDIVEASPELDVALRGNGASFCSGGDLDEFGLFLDPAHAHLVRMHYSIGARIDRLAARTTAYVHGHAGGSGLELAAFCSRIVADPHTTFFLPETGLGLIPGAGGTVSISRRIGQWRTAWMLLSASKLDAPTALQWGLVDAIA